MRVFRRPIHAGFVMVALAAMSISSCGHHAARVNAPIAPARIGTTETGVASWYGVPYDGRRAASGEVYDMRQLTAAHRSLPFQTWVEVTNLSNGEQVDVRINDRGPFVKGRIVDLSQAAARDIDMLRAGTARVRLKVIARPSVVPVTSPRPPSNIPPSTPPNIPPSTPPREPVEITAAPAVVAAPPTTLAIEPPIVDPAPPVMSSPVTSFPVTSPAITSPTVMLPNVTSTPITAPPVTAPTPAAGPAVRATVTPAPHAGNYAVQAGAFSDSARAESLRAVLVDHFADARVALSTARTLPLWRVIVGHQMTREQAGEIAIRVRREAGTAIVILEPEPVPNH
jgi:rare lipoprotein A